MNRRSHRLWALVSLVLVVGLGLGGCGRGQTTADPVQPAQVKLIPGTSLHLVTLTPQAMADVGIRTAPVRSATFSATPAPQGAHPRALTEIPLAAVIFDPQGRSWTYTIPMPRTFVRKTIVIDRMVGDEVLLSSGPPVGTPVVTVGAPELLGAEYGVGEE
jgi:hypothetical protein